MIRVEEEQKLYPRRFVLWAGPVALLGTAALALLAGAYLGKTPFSGKLFEDDQTRYDLYLPDGSRQPSQGNFVATFKNGVLQQIHEDPLNPLRAKYSDLAVDPFGITLHINTRTKPALTLSGKLSLDRKPFITWTSRIAGVDFQAPHDLLLKWSNWRLQSVMWDDREIDWRPPSGKTSVLIRPTTPLSDPLV